MNGNFVGNNVSVCCCTNKRIIPIVLRSVAIIKNKVIRGCHNIPGDVAPVIFRMSAYDARLSKQLMVSTGHNVIESGLGESPRTQRFSVDPMAHKVQAL